MSRRGSRYAAKRAAREAATGSAGEPDRQDGPAPPDSDDDRWAVAHLRGDGVEHWSDGVFVVRRATGSATTKAYRCPGCDHEIRPGTPHLVAWPEDDVDGRRHWHTPCWRSRMRRGAVVQRARNAPRYG